MHVSLSFQKTEGVLQSNQLLNDIEREVTDDINCVRVKAADVQHAAVFGVSDGQRVCNQSTHNQFGKYTAFLKKENTNRTKMKKTMLKVVPSTDDSLV